MPIYNGAKFIDTTLKTVLDQTYKDWEAVIIDGGSTDNSIELLGEYVKKYPNIHVFPEKCVSAYQAIWEGIKRAQGEFIYILCFSDGYLTNEWYAKCMELMEHDPELSLVWGIPFDLFEDPTDPTKEVLRPHYIFSHFLADKSQRSSESVVKRVLGRIKLTDPKSIARFFKKLNRSNITAASRLMKNQTLPIKQQWFEYWLETGTIFPDANMCVARNVLLGCMPSYKGGTDVGNWEELFFNIHSRGYLTQCIPIPANFGRLNRGQLSEVFSEYNDNNRVTYFKKLEEFRKSIKKGQENFSFRDRAGNPINKQ